MRGRAAGASGGRRHRHARPLSRSRCPTTGVRRPAALVVPGGRPARPRACCRCRCTRRSPMRTVDEVASAVSRFQAPAASVAAASMIALLASAVVAGYLPGALLFRLPIARSPSARGPRPGRARVLGRRHQRDADARRRRWSLAAVGQYQWRYVLVADLLVADDRGCGGPPRPCATTPPARGRLVGACAGGARGPGALGVPATVGVHRRRQGSRRVHERRRADRPARQPGDRRRAGGESAGRNARPVLSAPPRAAVLQQPVHGVLPARSRHAAR